MSIGSVRAAISRRTLPLAILAIVPVVFAACNQVGTSTLTFWDLVWGMIFFFFWMMAIWIFISLFADIFRRNDLSGGWKAIWILVLFIIPFLGALIYIIARPKVTPQDVQMMAQSEAAMKAASGVSVADQLEKLTQLRDSGAISVPEYEQLKAKLLAQ
jgi:Short C-terminal domain/Phospholipase_D-nuclease N-terminal